MAKEVKVFRGVASRTTTGTTVIYTVPTGRVAKITLGYLRISANSASTSCSLTVGGLDIVFVVGAIVQTYDFDASGSSTAGFGQKLAKASVAPLLRTIDAEFYLTAGDSVTASVSVSSGATAGILTYSFSAVEEY